MSIQKWPERMSLKESEEYLTHKNGGHRLYCEMTLRRMFQDGKLDGKQMGKGKKIFIYKSELDLKLLDRTSAS